MTDCTQRVCVLDLVNGDAPLNTIVHVVDTTICEIIPDNLELAKHFLDLIKDPKDYGLLACDLQVIYVFGHEADKDTILMENAKLRINGTSYHAAPLSGADGQLH